MTKVAKFSLIEYFASHNYIIVRIAFKMSIILMAILIRLVSYLVQINFDQLIVNQKSCLTKAITEPIRIELIRSVEQAIERPFIHKSLVSLKPIQIIEEETIESEDSNSSEVYYSIREKTKNTLELPMIAASSANTSLDALSDLDDSIQEIETVSDIPQKIEKIHECLLRAQEESLQNLTKYFHDNSYTYIKYNLYYNQEMEQEETNKKMDTTTDSSNGAMSNDNGNNSSRNNGLPDLINQKGNNDSTDKARKYLEGLDGVKFNEIQVPDQLKKQLEYFDRDELLQLIAYQKKYLDFKESRIKDLENYIDNLVVKIIEKEPSILMNASNVLTKSRNLI